MFNVLNCLFVITTAWGSYLLVVTYLLSPLFKIQKINPDVSVQLLEYDKRFEEYGSDFTFYDYNQPEELPSALKHAYQVIVADPPYLVRSWAVMLRIFLYLIILLLRFCRLCGLILDVCFSYKIVLGKESLSSATVIFLSFFFFFFPSYANRYYFSKNCFVTINELIGGCSNTILLTWKIIYDTYQLLTQIKSLPGGWS